jgi:uncharacterized repeat protein (TIGR01451 family)
MSADRTGANPLRARRTRSLALILLCALAMLLALAASALAAAPKWELTSTLTPENIPLTPTADEVEVLAVTGEEGETPNIGKFSLAFENNSGKRELTKWLPYAAGAAEVQAALQALPIIGAGNVTVTGGPEHLGGAGQGSWTYTVTFVGALGQRELEELEVEESSPTQKEEKEVKNAGGEPNEGTAEVNVTSIGVGDIVEYELLAANNGDAPTSAAVTVSDALPAGLSTVTTPEGEGWSCVPAAEGQTTVTCTTSIVIESGASAPPIYIEAYANTGTLKEGEQLVNRATASGGGAGEEEVKDSDRVGGPDAVTEAASAVAQTTATLNATVNPDGKRVAACEFEYGTSRSFGSFASCSPSPGSGSSAEALSAELAGLKPDTSYYFRVFATNVGGEGRGATGALHTLLPTAPTVLTGTASALAQTSATLNATVNANSGEVSECRFEYGPTDLYGASTPCAPLPTGATAEEASGVAGALGPRTGYHFRIVATNQGGASYGSDRTFTTLPTPQAPTPAPAPAPNQEAAAPTLVPAPTTTVTTGPSPAKVTLLSSTITVSSRRVATVRLLCAGAAECTGRLTLAATSTAEHATARSPRRYELGTGDFAIAPGKTRTISLPLDSAGRALLRAAHGHRRATLSILTLSPAPRRTQLVSIRLDELPART